MRSGVISSGFLRSAAAIICLGFPTVSRSCCLQRGAVLEDMGNRFADAMEGTKDEGASIRITSLTRTEAQQSACVDAIPTHFKGRAATVMVRASTWRSSTVRMNP